MAIVVALALALAVADAVFRFPEPIPFNGQRSTFFEAGAEAEASSFSG